MSRYIDADALISKAVIRFCTRDYFSAIITMIDNQPTADVVEVKHGRWIKDRLCSTSGGTYGVYRCSVCEDYFQDIGYGWNYCPNCGADMRSEE